jgi:hypothetical protein
MGSMAAARRAGSQLAASVTAMIAKAASTAACAPFMTMFGWCLWDRHPRQTAAD